MNHSKFMSAIMTDAFDDFDILQYNKLKREEKKERTKERKKEMEQIMLEEQKKNAEDIFEEISEDVKLVDRLRT